jgi:hypothetical protein
MRKLFSENKIMRKIKRHRFSMIFGENYAQNYRNSELFGLGCLLREQLRSKPDQTKNLRAII